MKPPKASFVIPAYNAQAFLAETIQSCLEQTQPRIEIVVVDDGSTDATPDLLTHFQYQDERVRVIRLEQNMGRSAARNRGISEAQADIIMTMDSDDISMPDRAEKTIKFFKKSPDVDLVYCDCQNIDAIGDLIIYQDPRTGRQMDTLLAKPLDIERLKKTGNTYIPAHSGLSFRKHVFDKIQYQSGPWCAHAIDDWKFELDAIKAGLKFGTISKTLVRYRVIKKKRDEEAIKALKKEVMVGL